MKFAFGFAVALLMQSLLCFATYVFFGFVTWNANWAAALGDWQEASRAGLAFLFLIYLIASIGIASIVSE